MGMVRRRVDVFVFEVSAVNLAIPNLHCRTRPRVQSSTSI